VAKGIELLDRVSGNRAIVVMTDGEDTGSKLRYPDFWRLLDAKRIRLYTIGLGTALHKPLPVVGTSPVRMMTHASMATNGRFYFAKTSDELKGLYQQIADELRSVATYYVRPTVSQESGSVSVTATGERLAQPGRILLILDASGSMKRTLGGRTMMEIAKDALSDIVKKLPDDAQLALRVYGHRIREGRLGDCKDTELLVPFGATDKRRLLDKIRAIHALGTTPIEYTLRQIPRDVGKTPGQKLVILVTDGKEECKGDPAAAVADLVAKGLDFRLNVVGFALADAATRSDMDRIARSTGGRFFDAKDAPSLVRAITQSLTVPYEVLDAAGDKVATGVVGESAITVPEGTYTLAIHAGGKPVTVSNVRIARNQVTSIQLRKEGREVGITVSAPQ
jgi:Mg-chelatase subunit ChlD